SRPVHSFPTRRSSDLLAPRVIGRVLAPQAQGLVDPLDGTVERCESRQIQVGTRAEAPLRHREDALQESPRPGVGAGGRPVVAVRSEEHTSELQSLTNL